MTRLAFDPWGRLTIRAERARDVRASDAERERAAELLRQAAGDGRLTADEAGERLAAAAAATNRGELERLLVDLPDGLDSRPTYRGGAGRGFRLLMLMMIVAGAWALWGPGIWLVWPLLFLPAFMVRRRYRRRWWRGDVAW